ncbi:YppE family protein [Oceanobacillus jeddahense]|uniref:YppE family protein n=1 Tax=Oceanobacillus jeddahense TaxID=1462527 RepID=A0ABY5JQ59_9BACI|nr:YppE family protein [Oceanobacillus jeddahense]UUI00997.1 YppE family protein [Oceanobacillus jeddahense]
MKLSKQTEKLNQYLETLRERFDNSEAPSDRKDRDFFNLVKEETAPIYDLLETWEKDASAAVKERKASVHPNQIQSTRENMELLLMHSYYLDVRRKRYIELYTSIRYVFDLLLDTLEEDN